MKPGTSDELQMSTATCEAGTRRWEYLIAAGFTLLGLYLRIAHLSRDAVEHFDEGIYSSVLWYDFQFGIPYPGREFYAPPFFGWLISLSDLVPALQDFSPLVPAIAFGTLTIPAAWWVARLWYGGAAGLFAAAIVSMSEFHIIYSRMALTDVVCLFWMFLAVGMGALSIQTRCLRRAVLSGLLCGIGWWTKYTGWLPLAILLAGTSLWWGRKGRKEIPAARFLQLQFATAVTAILVFLPWWLKLQPVGGYSAVAANHAGYLADWNRDLPVIWKEHLIRQLAAQFRLDGGLGAMSLALGMLTAGGFRWIASVRSTWNGYREQSSHNGSQRPFPSRWLLVRFIVAALVLGILARRIHTPLMLLCLGLAGLAGIQLWPVLQRLHDRRRRRDLSPTRPNGGPLVWTDLSSGSTINPDLGLCLTAVWLAAMLVVTPLYSPYSRLFFPLLAATWIAAAGGVSWWLESSLSVARNSGTAVPVQPRTRTQHTVNGILLGAVMIAFFEVLPDGEIQFFPVEQWTATPAFFDRSGIQSAASEVAGLCIRNVLNPEIPSQRPVSSATIHPGDILNRPGADQLRTDVAAEQISSTECVIYAYGEPAFLFHLARLGMTVAPVAHLNLTSESVPGFLILGPHAKRTPGFWEQFLEHESHFQSVGEVSWSPGEISLLDLFSPQWLRDHPESSVQVIEVFRIR